MCGCFKKNEFKWKKVRSSVSPSSFPGLSATCGCGLPCWTTWTDNISLLQNSPSDWLRAPWPFPGGRDTRTLSPCSLSSLPREGSHERVPEGPAVKGGREGHDGVGHRQEAEEQHQQQEPHVEVVGPGGFEHALVGDVAAHHSPALEVHGAQQTQHVDTHQARRVEGAHPGRAETALVVGPAAGKARKG